MRFVCYACSMKIDVRTENREAIVRCGRCGRRMRPPRSEVKLK